MTRPPVVAFVFLMLLVVAAPIGAQPVVGQSRSDAEEAAQVAIKLSELESNGRGSLLYHRMHSDAREIIPKEAVVGWYESEFFPLGPQPIVEITSVEFVTWTWPVTGQSYPNTAEVSFVQPFGSGSSVSYVEETVRLVAEDGTWRWFFGRSAEFVDEQVARYKDNSTSQSRTNQTVQRESGTGSSDPDDYTLMIVCSRVEAVVGNVVYAYCDWPFLLSAPYYCVAASVSADAQGATFLCNQTFERNVGNPDEIKLEYAPKLIYTIPVTCEVVKQNGVPHQFCHWPVDANSSWECVVDESRLTMPYEKFLLCRP